MTVSGSRDHQQPTDEDEGEANEEGQDVSPQRFVVLSIALGKDAQARVDVIFAQCLGSTQLESFTQFIRATLVEIQLIQILDDQAFCFLSNFLHTFNTPQVSRFTVSDATWIFRLSLS